MKEKLLKSSPRKVLLHGDLHHENILKHKNGWIAIDPKGVIGDPLFEVTAFLYNPLPDFFALPHPKDTLHKRIHLFAKELNVDHTLIAEWGYLRAILSICWALEDKLDPTFFLSYLKLLEAIYN